MPTQSGGHGTQHPGFQMGCEHSLSRKRRLGLATLEFTLAVPFLVVIAAAVFALGSANVRRGTAILTARQDAWKARFGGLPSEPGPLTRAGFDKVLPGPGGAHPGISTKNVTKKVSLPAYLKIFVTDAKAKHSVLGGSYDWRNMDFNQGSPLTPSRRALDFSTQAVNSFLENAASFDTLLQMAGQQNGSLDDIRKLTDRITRIVRAVERVVQRLNEFVDRLEDVKDSVESFNPFATAAAIARLIASVERLASSLMDLAAAVVDGEDFLAMIREANNLSGSNAQTPRQGNNDSFDFFEMITKLPDMVKGVDSLGQIFSSQNNLPPVWDTMLGNLLKWKRY